jgi:hypothetical protein
LSNLEWLFEWHRRFLEEGAFPIWPNNRNSTENLLNAIFNMYSAIEEEYGGNTALWASTHDLRYWILVNLRRIQEKFVDLQKPDNIADNERELAFDEFERFNTIITNLIEIRRPEGNEDSYRNIKFHENPYAEGRNEGAT